jgi:hypothetical protein
MAVKNRSQNTSAQHKIETFTVRKFFPIRKIDKEVFLDWYGWKVLEGPGFS